MEKSEYTALAKKAEKLDLTDEERKKYREALFLFRAETPIMK